jgi:putative membrane protein
MEQKKIKNTTDHLANERTFLAWVRTSIGLMAFGFVVVKFSLFVKQLSLLLGKHPAIQQKGYSAIMGIALVAAGTISAVMAYVRYKKTEKQINENNYRSSPLLTSILIGFIFLISVLLIAYLIESVNA